MITNDGKDVYQIHVCSHCDITIFEASSSNEHPNPENHCNDVFNCELASNKNGTCRALIRITSSFIRLGAAKKSGAYFDLYSVRE